MLAQDSDRYRVRSTTEDPIRHVSDEPTRQRKIIHIDMDAFYASVEQRDNPELRGKPVAVGGSRERGVAAAASYEAREFGVHSAMPSATAKRKCPNLIFVKPRFDVYKVASLQIRAIFAEYTPIVEPLSLDEAYLDVTENLKGFVSATQIAETIRAKIRTETGLTASAGVSYNKFLAKLASDQAPDRDSRGPEHEDRDVTSFRNINADWIALSGDEVVALQRPPQPARLDSHHRIIRCYPLVATKNFNGDGVGFDSLGATRERLLDDVA